MSNRKGKWKNRAEHNDHLWAECSECGFRVENYKAVEIGRSSDDYTAFKYHYCPICGAEMIDHQYEIGQKIEFTQEGMKPLLHGRIIDVHHNYVTVKCKNGCHRYPSIDKIIRVMD